MMARCLGYLTEDCYMDDIVEYEGGFFLSFLNQSGLGPSSSSLEKACTLGLDQC